ncbi:MAG: hypothetical protein ACM3X9_14800 [Bacillota bacterium]
MLFSLGQVVATPGALESLEKNNLFPDVFLRRHLSGDWGDLAADDAKMNDEAVKSGKDRVFSAYILPDKSKIWIITEWDRSVTTILLPSEY